MITCHLEGGLGNQLFKIFATIAYAIQHNTSFCFAPQINTAPGTIIRYTYWNSFLYALQPFTKKMANPTIGIREQGFHYTPLPSLENSNQDALLVGYFQSPKYFEAQFDTICRMIRYKTICATFREQYPVVSSSLSNTISMHFRLGDYKNLPDYYPILTKEYYERALNYILSFIEEEKTITVYYFCEREDNTVVSAMIEDLRQKETLVTFHKVADSMPDWEQMIFMSLCRHHIIANSTFSWWGAYFSKAVIDSSSITCYPKKWFGKNLANHRMDDLFPNDWVAIE